MPSEADRFSSFFFTRATCGFWRFLCCLNCVTGSPAIKCTAICWSPRCARLLHCTLPHVLVTIILSRDTFKRAVCHRSVRSRRTDKVDAFCVGRPMSTLVSMVSSFRYSPVTVWAYQDSFNCMTQVSVDFLLVLFSLSPVQLCGVRRCLHLLRGIWMVTDVPAGTVSTWTRDMDAHHGISLSLCSLLSS